MHHPPGPYRIHVAAELSGVSAATLRAWERRYGVPRPDRTSTAYRLYSAHDVAMIARMRHLIEQGLAPAEAARQVLATTDGPRASHLPEPSLLATDAAAHARSRLLAAVSRWDARGIDDELAKLSLLVDVQSLYTNILGPVLVEVGEMWQRGELSVAQEHMLSEKVEHVLRGALQSVNRATGPLCVMATLAGDLHVMGLLGAAIRVTAMGMRVLMLGASAPPDAIRDAVCTIQPRIVALSATIVPEAPRQLLLQYARSCGDTPWVLGGPAASALREVAIEVGARAVLSSDDAWPVAMVAVVEGAA